ncbi:MAG: Txe/YoeB family addiction module toxin [Clostridiaceae bacterium]|nr:Txe/YoeB family addiction module toxin [Clostridiaceae bacterium]
MTEQWKIVYTKDALKDKRTAYEAGFKEKIEQLLEVVKDDPFNNYPPYEKLLGDMSGAYSRRINIQHRLVYSVYNEERTVKIISMWSHYE